MAVVSKDLRSVLVSTDGFSKLNSRFETSFTLECAATRYLGASTKRYIVGRREVGKVPKESYFYDNFLCFLFFFSSLRHAPGEFSFMNKTKFHASE